MLKAVFETRALTRSADKGAPLLALGAEVAVGDVARPETLASALEGCAGVFSAFSASTDRQAGEVEYRGNVNLLSAGGRRAAPSTARPCSWITRWRGGSGPSGRRLASRRCCSALAKSPRAFCAGAVHGDVAHGPQRARGLRTGSQRCPVRWISAGDVALAAVRAFERDITGRHEPASLDSATFRRGKSPRGGGSGHEIAVLRSPLHHALGRRPDASRL